MKAQETKFQEGIRKQHGDVITRTMKEPGDGVLKPTERKGVKKESMLNGSNVFSPYSTWGSYSYTDFTHDEAGP